LVHRQAVINRHQRSQYHAAADAGQRSEPAHQKTDQHQHQKETQRHGVLPRRKTKSSSLPAPASARNTVPTDASTIMITITIVNGICSRKNAPSSTATTGTTRLVVASW